MLMKFFFDDAAGLYKLRRSKTFYFSFPLLKLVLNHTALTLLLFFHYVSYEVVLRLLIR